MDKVTEYISRVENAIYCAESNTTKLTEQQFAIGGMSSRKVRILLNEMIKQDTRYLEIGVWCGSTFISALYGNSYKSATAIDDFSEFTDESYLPECKNAEDIMRLAEMTVLEEIVASGNTLFLKNCAKNGIEEFNLIESDCFNMTQSNLDSIKDIDVYLYDGGHSEEEQRKALTYYIDKLSDVFILIVDDWNFPEAKSGTRLGIEDTNIKIHKKWELHANGNAYSGGGDLENWWNGYYIAVCEKQK
jgi:precorrin-6B methylase 2